jgi:Co/Zn/Cd efflux system component
MNDKRIALWISVAGLIVASVSLIIFSQTGQRWAITAMTIAVLLIIALLAIRGWLETHGF